MYTNLDEVGRLKKAQVREKLIFFLMVKVDLTGLRESRAEGGDYEVGPHRMTEA